MYCIHVLGSESRLYNIQLKSWIFIPWAIKSINSPSTRLSSTFTLITSHWKCSLFDTPASGWRRGCNFHQQLQHMGDRKTSDYCRVRGWLRPDPEPAFDPHSYWWVVAQDLKLLFWCFFYHSWQDLLGLIIWISIKSLFVYELNL